jgi:hypothetical protein
MIAQRDRSRRTIILVSLFICFVFPCFAAGTSGNSQTVPQSFEHIDFKNHPYGVFKISSGKRIALTLKNGELEYDYSVSDRGWFRLKDVYYTDTNGDGTPEAVVLLSHVQCGVSCDGGSALIYIYAVRKGKLQTLWQYETGSLAYGCGLKSLVVQNKQIVVESFGRCPRSARDYPGPAKYVVENMTRSVFRFNGRRFTRISLEFISAPARNVGNYKPEIQIR